MSTSESHRGDAERARLAHEFAQRNAASALERLEQYVRSIHPERMTAADWLAMRGDFLDMLTRCRALMLETANTLRVIGEAEREHGHQGRGNSAKDRAAKG